MLTPAPTGGTVASMDDATRRVTLRLPKELADNVEKRAREKGLTLNEWVAKAVAIQYAKATNEGTAVTETRTVWL